MTKKILLPILLLLFTLTAFSQNEKFSSLLKSKYETFLTVNLPNKPSVVSFGKEFDIIQVKELPDEKGYSVKICLPVSDNQKFISKNLDFIIDETQRDVMVDMATSVEQLITGWNYYPTYPVYEQYMEYCQNSFPNQCKIDTICADTYNHHKLLVAHISADLNDNSPKSQFFYTSTMHGNETAGFYFMLRLINYLLNNQNNPIVYKILHEVDLWICPVENPDGTYRSNNNILGGNNSTRMNYNGVDLNRNYPFAFATIGTGYEREIESMMNFMNNHNFVMSANLHSGSELFNYIWDTYTSSELTHPDHQYWNRVGRSFADTCHTFHSTYFTDPNPSCLGVIEGGNWYVITGSRQDYANYHIRCREVTLEVSSAGTPSNTQVKTLWGYINHSLINYILESVKGVNGIVTDSLTGEPLNASVFINGYDDATQHSNVFSHLPDGDYYRPVLDGTYSITYSAAGYYPKTISVTVANSQPVHQNVQLTKISTQVVSVKNYNIIIYPNPVESGTVNIKTENNNIGFNIKIYNSKSQLIAQKRSCNGELQIDVSNFHKGIYFVNIITENNISEIKKMIIY